MRRGSRSTASARRARDEERHQSQHAEHDQGQNEEENVTSQDGVEQGNEEEEEVDATYPFPGGPIVGNLLHSYKDHVVAKITIGNERDVLKCFNHTGKLKQWILGTEVSPLFYSVLQNSRLAQISALSYSDVDKVLVSAFVEHWHPETNSFHLPFGEMTITLDDVKCLTGLPSTGYPLNYNVANFVSTPTTLVAEVLGVSEAEALVGMKGPRGSSIKLEWLRTTFQGKMTSNDRVTIVFAVKAYILYLLGCTLFSDKTGTGVNLYYLEFLRDVENPGGYAWGAGTLAFLYRQLGQGSRHGCKQIAGYLTLLEAWIYERFPVFRPDHSISYVVGQPLAMKWLPLKGQGSSSYSLQSKREEIDCLRATDVMWTPYTSSVRETYHFSRVALFLGCIAIGSVIEPHLPNRVLRQFGYVQNIPELPIAHNITSRVASKNVSLWMALAQYFENWSRYLLSDDQLTRRAQLPHETTLDYLEWYARHSHPIVHPEHLRSQAVRGTTEVVVPDPWEMVRSSRAVMEPFLERWSSGDRTITVDEAMDIVYRTYASLSAPSEQSGPLTSRPRRNRRR